MQLNIISSPPLPTGWADPKFQPFHHHHVVGFSGDQHILKHGPPAHISSLAHFSVRLPDFQQPTCISLPNGFLLPGGVALFPRQHVGSKDSRDLETPRPTERQSDLH